MRVRDDHILTVDQITFIADERFHAYHATENGMAQQSSPSSSSSSMSTLSNQRRQLASGNNVGGGSNSVSSQKSHGSDTDANGTGGNAANSANAPWTLQIKYVQARDAGLYECQISSEPKISARVYLHVVGKLNKQTFAHIFSLLQISLGQQFFMLSTSEKTTKKYVVHRIPRCKHAWQARATWKIINFSPLNAFLSASPSSSPKSTN